MQTPGRRMSTESPFPSAPATDIEVVEDHSAERAWDEGFLRVRRLSIRNKYEDGTQSRSYAYDFVEREAMDAVAIILEAAGGAHGRICMRTALRPPLAFRSNYQVPIVGGDSPVVWEVPAGLIEPNERGIGGIKACAARETLEEVGLALLPADFSPLGGPVTLSPGVIGEHLHFYLAQADPAKAGEPTEDGSPAEERARISWVPLEVALRAVDDGTISDVKTEVAIWRLARLRGVI